MNRIAVISPLFNDWDCLPSFLAELGALSEQDLIVDAFIVDDGSTQSPVQASKLDVAGLRRLEIIRLGDNLGHQRAIAVGLVSVSERQEHDAIVVMDADGEDDPTNIPNMIHAWSAMPESVVVAQRRSRTDGVRFRAFYTAYKILFRLLTGERLDFGNFSVLSPVAARRLSLMPELWNHYPATVMVSRLVVERLPLDRRQRYSGQSQMNFTSLVNHGLSGIAAFLNRVFTRLIIFAGALIAVFTSLAFAAIVIRLAAGVPIPGWAALGGSVALIGAIQVTAVLLVLAFMTLSTRSIYSPPPSDFVHTYIAEIEVWK